MTRARKPQRSAASQSMANQIAALNGLDDAQLNTALQRLAKQAMRSGLKADDFCADENMATQGATLITDMAVGCGAPRQGSPNADAPLRAILKA